MKLGPGTHRLRIADLPRGLGLDDVRVGASGPEGLQLGDLGLETEVRVTKESPAWKAMETELEGFQGRLDQLWAERSALAPEVAFLKGLLASQEKEQSGKLTATLPSAQSLVELSKGLQQRLGEVLIRDKQMEREVAKLQASLSRLQAEMAKRLGERSQGPSRATVEVGLARAGEVTVEFSYRTREARWEPTYEARLSPDGKRLDLVLFAAVRQRSGEDWKEVAVEISNVRPGRSLTLPRYTQGQSVGWYTHRSHSPSSSGAVVEVLSGASVRDNMQASYAPTTPTTMAPPPAATAAQELEATRTNEGPGLGVTFKLEGIKDIPSDGEPQRFRIHSVNADHRLVIMTTPRLDPTAFQVARFPSPKGIPLFPGAPLVQYVGTQRLGQTAFTLPEPGKSFQLAFGPYRPMRVALRRLDLQRESVGFVSRERQWTLEERIELASEAEEPLEVEVFDRLLQASDDKVRITTLPPTQAPTTVEGQVGIWKLRLEPGKPLAIPLKTQIRGPEGGYISGLEGLGLY